MHWLAKRSGLEIHRRGPSELGLHLRQLFQQQGVDHALDVGANVGQYVAFLRSEVGFSGEIDSFEPVPECFTELSRRHESDQHWRGHAVALGSRDEVLELNVAHATDLSSFHQRTDDADAVFGDHIGTTRTVPMTVKALDGIVQEIVRPDARLFLKVDTQGHDAHVLKGAEQVLDRCVGLHLELSFGRLYQDAPLADDVIRDLRDRGFAPTCITVISRLADRLRIAEAECVFIRG